MLSSVLMLPSVNFSSETVDGMSNHSEKEMDLEKNGLRDYDLKFLHSYSSTQITRKGPGEFGDNYEAYSKDESNRAGFNESSYRRYGGGAGKNYQGFKGNREYNRGNMESYPKGRRRNDYWNNYDSGANQKASENLTRRVFVKSEQGEEKEQSGNASEKPKEITEFKTLEEIEETQRSIRNNESLEAKTLETPAILLGEIENIDSKIQKPKETFAEPEENKGENQANQNTEIQEERKEPQVHEGEEAGNDQRGNGIEGENCEQAKKKKKKKKNKTKTVAVPKYAQNNPFASLC